MLFKKVDKKPKAVIFDWDNTLVDTWPVIIEAVNATLLHFGHQPWDVEYAKQNIHKSAKDAFPAVFKEKSDEAIAFYLEQYKKLHTGTVSPLKNAQDLLNKLQNYNIYLAIVSNKTGDILRNEVKIAGWEHYFSKIIGSKDTEEDKPSPKPVIAALEGSNIQLNNCVWFVGDTIADIECAHNAHITAVYFNELNICTNIFKYCKPHLHVRNHAELMNLIGE